MNNTYRFGGIIHGAHEGCRLDGARAHCLCATLSVETGHGGLVGQAELARILFKNTILYDNIC